MEPGDDEIEDIDIPEPEDMKPPMIPPPPDIGDIDIPEFEDGFDETSVQ
jgi:hypothetical protein